MVRKTHAWGNLFIGVMFELPTAPGARLTRRQVLFSWALAEAYSPRWRAGALEPLSDGLRRKIERGEIRDFSDGEQEEMIAAFTARPDRSYFIEEYIDKSAGYKIIPLSGEQIGKIAVLPTFSWKKYPVPLGAYIEGEIDETWEADPRNAAKAFLNNPPPAVFTGYPIVAFNPQLQTMVLVDGYTRCITALMRQSAGEILLPTPIIYCAPKLGVGG